MRCALLILFWLLSLSSMMGQEIVSKGKQTVGQTEVRTNRQSAIVNDSTMYIGQDVDSLTEEEQYFNPVYLLVQKGKEYLKEQLIRGSVCDCDTTQANRRIGIFSVAPNKYVSFSQGNLQYLPDANLWKFADEQYEYLGNANKYISSTYRNWLDLFGWSAENAAIPYGANPSQDISEYVGDASRFLDWGTNKICGDPPGTWRTLTKEEWDYLYSKRNNAKNLRFYAQVNGTKGYVLLPDQWQTINGKKLVEAPLSSMVILTIEEWLQLEVTGAVFLPNAGYRYGTTYYSGNRYWLATKTNNNKAYCTDLDVAAEDVVIRTGYFYPGISVRLVHDTLVPQVIPDSCMVVKINDSLSINMMYVEGGMFKPTGQNDSVSLQDYYMLDTEVTQALWEAVMQIPVPKTTRNHPMHGGGKLTWKDTQVFIERLNRLTGLCFSLPTKEQWEFAAMGGVYSHGYTYSGSNDAQEVAWCSQPKNSTTHPVAQKKPNELGLYDMSGNVWEWCQETEKGYPYCGGGIVWEPQYCTVHSLYYHDDTYIGGLTGFRIILNDTTCTLQPEYVDLGLSVKWATFNVGASKPEDYGDYFAWGETEPKEVYNWATYKWCDGTSSNMTKYNVTDGLTTLELSDDAAHVRWGDKWRMPTDDEMTELRKKCTWTWITQNGINGCKVVGPNGNSIFLPVAGYKSGTSVNDAESHGDYWSSSLDVSHPHTAYSVNGRFSSSGSVFKYNDLRFYGFSIRPVYDEGKWPETCKVVKVNDTLSINMMYVEGGTFMMGASDDDKEAEADERPRHQVTLSDYYIGQTEVTQALWEAVMGSNPSYFKGDNLPVEGVSWLDCQSFVEKLNQLTGLRFRLPTEAEWEYAASGGRYSHGYMYSGSNVADSVAWNDKNAPNGTKTVGQLQPNELGIYDMSGNVYEFCQDWYDTYPSEAQTNPQGPNSSPKNYRTTRGGSWGNHGYGRVNFCCVTNRGQASKDATYRHGGFRLVHDIDLTPIPQHEDMTKITQK